MARAGGGGGGESAYNNQVCTLVSGTNGQSTNPYVKVTYTSATQGGGTQVTTNTVITGATSDTLTLKADRVGIQSTSPIPRQNKTKASTIRTKKSGRGLRRNLQISKNPQKNSEKLF